MTFESSELSTLQHTYPYDWHVRGAAIIANDWNCPDRSKDPYKNLMIFYILWTLLGRGVLQLLSHACLLQKSSSITLPRSCCTCINFEWHLRKGINYLNISWHQKICQKVGSRATVSVCLLLSFTSQSSAEAVKVIMVKCVGLRAMATSFQSPASPLTAPKDLSVLQSPCLYNEDSRSTSFRPVLLKIKWVYIIYISYMYLY